MSNYGGAVAQMATDEEGPHVGKSVRARVKQFLMENFYVSDPSELDADTSLLTTGTVDSTGMLEVIAFLESEYGIKVLDPEMIPANLETLGRITAFVERKTRAER
jgi:acyl carrier protein